MLKFGATSFAHSVPATTGDTYFVDLENGSDAHDGKSAETPFLTLTAALAACANNHDDLILVSGTGTVTSSVRVTKSGVSIIGIPVNDSPLGGEARIATDGAIKGALVINADKVRVEGIRFTVADANAIGINVRDESGASYQCVFRNLCFTLTGAAVGIFVEGTLANSLIEECVFINDVTGGGTGIAANGAGNLGDTMNNIIRVIYGKGPLAYVVRLTSSSNDDVSNVTSVQAVASVNVTGASSSVISCKTSVAPSGTALAGDNTTIS